ncbi:MAG: ABC transporter ATP-binding protein [Oscillospiraceae bacterium]
MQTTNKDEDYVTFSNVSKYYKSGLSKIVAVNNISFKIKKGEFCVIVGPSGAGKTTVLNMLGGMDACDEGKIILDGEKINEYNAKKLTAYRRYDVGFVFQFYNLVQNLTALENVELAAEICKNPLDAKTTLEKVGLGERINNFPAQLSGGEQQRVSIARALAKNPKILLCDEPTGALDYMTGKHILQLLQDTCRNTGTTVIVITHNSALTAMADRVIHVKNGQVSSIETNEIPMPIERIEW